MRAAGRTAVGDGEDGVGAQGNVQPVQARDHFANAILAHLLKPGHFVQEPPVLRIDKVTEQVQFVAVEFRRQLRRRDEFQAGPPAGNGHAGAAFHGVVVGQGDGGQSHLAGALGQFLRRVGAVGEIRVEMEIGETHVSGRAIGFI